MRKCWYRLPTATAGKSLYEASWPPVNRSDVRGLITSRDDPQSGSIAPLSFRIASAMLNIPIHPAKRQPLASIQRGLALHCFLQPAIPEPRKHLSRHHRRSDGPSRPAGEARTELWPNHALLANRLDSAVAQTCAARRALRPRHRRMSFQVVSWPLVSMLRHLRRLSGRQRCSTRKNRFEVRHGEPGREESGASFSPKPFPESIDLTAKAFHAKV